MDFESEKLELFRANQKTQFIAGQFDLLAEQKAEAETLAVNDPEMAELAAEAIKEIDDQLAIFYTQMEEIVKADKEEDSDDKDKKQPAKK